MFSQLASKHWGVYIWRAFLIIIGSLAVIGFLTTVFSQSIPTNGETSPSYQPYPPPEHSFSADEPFVATLHTTAMEYDPAQATKVSDMVILGVVTGISLPRWSTDDGERPLNPFTSNAFIYRLVTITVEETLKGNNTKEVTIAVTGGDIGKDSMWIEPKARYSFEVGERVILFLPREAVYLKGQRHNFFDRYTVTNQREAVNERRHLPLNQILQTIRQESQ